MAIKWSKFWLAKTDSEKNDHTTKVNTEKNRRRRQQEDIDLEAKLQENEDATTNFITAAGGERMAAQVRALCLPLLVCRFTLSAAARLYGVLQTPGTKKNVSR
jgi:hypothetical protein